MASLYKMSNGLLGIRGGNADSLSVGERSLYYQYNFANKAERAKIESWLRAMDNNRRGIK